MTTPRATTRERVPVYGIDLIRFVAASMVMLYHFSAKPFLTPDATTLKAVLVGVAPSSAPSGMVWWGWIGVQIFFVISGAVISYSAARATPRSFFVGRLARLWPAMLICTAIIAGFNLAWWGHEPLQEAGLVVRSLLFWPPGPWVSGQIWTLPIEIAFYGLIWLLIMAGLANRLEQVAWVLGTLSCAFWLMQVAGYVTPSGLLSWLLLQHGVYFALGMTIMSAGVNGPSVGRGILAAICCIGAWLEIESSTLREAPDTALSSLTPFLVWLALCALIWGAVVTRRVAAELVERRRGWAGVLRTVGLATYPLYLVHLQPGGVVYARLLAAGVPVWPAVLAACLAALALAVVIARVLEPPLHGVVKRGIEAVLDISRRRPAEVSRTAA